MQLLLQSVQYTYPQAMEPVFSAVTVTFPVGWTGIVGDNGSGKTTLSLLACGMLAPDAGTVSPRLLSCYCSQDATAAPENLVDFACAYDGHAIELRRLMGLEDDWPWRFETLSCGQQKRLQIACALWASPDVLVLDEPTNHVDAPTREALGMALARFKGIGLLISHDRDLLDFLCDRCLFVSHGNAVMRPGSYTQASSQLELERESVLRQREDAKREVNRLKREAQQRREQAQKRASKRSARNVAKHDSDARERIRLAVYSGKDGVAGKLATRMDTRVDRANDQLRSLHVEKRYSANLWIDAGPSRRHVVLHHGGCALPLGDEVRLEVPELFVGNEDHIGLAAPNGWGKSTLLRRLVQDVAADVPLLHIPQELDGCARHEVLARMRDLDDERRGRVLRIVSSLNSDPKRLLEGDEVSPGEMRKLMLALGILEAPELIVMDEPTNHLDLDSVRALERLLSAFPGALLLVSHDARLLDAVTDMRWSIERVEGDLLRLNVCG